MLGATALLACALAYNNATRTRYPKGTREPAAPSPFNFETFSVATIEKHPTHLYAATDKTPSSRP